MKKLLALFLSRLGLSRYAFFLNFFIFLSSMQLLFPLDLPVRYYPPSSRGRPASTVNDWVAYPQVSYRAGHATRSYQGHSHKTTLLNAHGPVALAPLGCGVSGKDEKPKTAYYWHNDKLFLEDPSSSSVIKLPPETFGDFVCNKPCTGYLDLAGKYSIDELKLEWRQNLFWGLFAHLFVPIKKQKISCISYTNCSKNPEKKIAQITDFLKNDFDIVLAENNFKPIKSCFKKTGVGDCALSVGWQGQTERDLGIISELKGMIFTGLIFPSGAKKELDLIASLPQGYDDHWAVLLRIQAEAGVWRYFHLGLSAGIITLLKSTKKMRVCSDPLKRQQGVIMLEKTLINQDSGSICDIEGYLLATAADWGPFVQAGFSYLRQEREHLVVRDHCFLDQVRKNALETRNTNFICPDDVVNSSETLRSWETFVFHLIIGYEATQLSKKCTPTVSFSYDLPFLGKYTFATSMLGGSIGCCCSFAF